MGCLLSWSWYGYAIQLGQLERLRFCLSKFCIPGLGEFLACEESLSPSKEGGSPSNVSESESDVQLLSPTIQQNEFNISKINLKY